MSTAPSERRLVDLWPAVALLACIAAFLVPVAIGSAGARAGAAAGLIGLASGIAVGGHRVRAAHRTEGSERPTWPESISIVVLGAGRAWIGVAVFLTLSYIAAVAPGAEGRAQSSWLNPVLAAAAALLLAVHMATTVRRLWRQEEGVERQVFLEATSISFFVTLVAAAAYALFEQFTGAPQLSMWAVWMFGMATWAAISWYRMRQFR